MHVDEGKTAYIHEHDYDPDQATEAIPTAIIEDDQGSNSGDAIVQLILFTIALILLILLILFLARGITPDDLIRGGNDDPDAVLLAPQLDNSANRIVGLSSAIDPDWVFPDGSERPPVDPLFADYWELNGGVRIFGYPESPLLEENGRRFQWFQRARLESWPENEPPYNILPGRLGIEFTDGRDFPRQEFFVNRPGLWYFKETEHGVADPFLEFWQTYGGVDIFGYPISDQVLEVLPEDGAVHTVQYFERARLELHEDDPNQPIKIGLLGTSLYLLDSQPNIIEPIKPTPVPLER